MKNRQRKFLLLLPVLIIPFLTLAFWALGGGKDNAAQPAAKGLNTTMPGAVLKDEKGLTKMSFYDEAALDSVKQKDREKNDPFFAKPPSLGDLSSLTKSTGVNYSDPNEAKVYEKLAQLNAVMHQPEPIPPGASTAAQNDPNIDRLQQMVHDVKEQSSDDTEMQRLNEMMDKLIAIQHPEAAKDTAKKPVQQKETLVVSATDTLPVHSGFYSLEDDNKVAVSNVIRASIPETQTIVAGSTVKLLLLQDVTIKGRTIPSNTFVYGTASLSNERLKIAITSLRAGNSILPVSLEVFDMDGLVGIYVPGSINRDVAKQSTEEAVSGMGLTTLDPSIGAQAASAGIQAAKSLIGKKVRLIKVTVRAGYQILLQQIN